MRVSLQRGQLVRVIAAPPAVEALPADAEMATGEGCVAPVVQVVIHPLKPLNRIAAQLPPGAHKLAGTGWLSPSNLHGDTLLRVSPIILNENSAGRTGSGVLARASKKQEKASGLRLRAECRFRRTT